MSPSSFPNDGDSNQPRAAHPAQLAVVFLELGQALGITGRGPDPGTLVDLCLGRPGTPTDQAWIESLNGHAKAAYPHLVQVSDPATYVPSSP